MAGVQFTVPEATPHEQSFRNIAQQLELNDIQIARARIAGVTNGAEFFSYLSAASSSVEQEIYDIPDLTERLLSNTNVSVMIEKTTKSISSDSFSFGAVAPAEAAYKDGDSAPELTQEETTVLASFEPGPLANEEPVFARICGEWPIRDQGQRGTCVSFATIAAFELYTCAKFNRSFDFSEQFLYWAIKHNRLDSWPNTDGTWHRYAVDALQQYGVCNETSWPYSPVAIPGSTSHNPPPNGAITSAATNRTSIPTARDYTARSGKAQQLLALLRQHNGVAIALPVFNAPNGGRHNWSTRVAQTFGYVQTPAPGWIAKGGHAVLCVGFVPDPLEPLGGHFIIRNSWNTSWGHALPDSSYAGPQPGYGQIPASYIDRYLWETCAF